MLGRQIARLVGIALVTAIAGAGCITIERAAVPTDAGSQASPLQTGPHVATRTLSPSQTPPAATAGRTTDIVTPTHTPAETPTESPTATPTTRPTATPTVAPSDPPTGGRACEDDAYTLTEDRWDVPFRWYFNEDNMPSRFDADAVVEVIQRSFDNIANVRNDCGLADNVDITARYAGPTGSAPCPERATNDFNIVGFAHLPPRESGLLAYVCPYGEPGTPAWRTDVVINADVPWALSVDECEGFEELLEATMTHEIGHIFGLGHVGERRHGHLTMSTRSNGPCVTDEITLGLGDVLGLEELYPAE